MARTYTGLGPQMSRKQFFLGWLYFPFFALLASVIIYMVFSLLKLPMDDFVSELLFSAINLVFVLAVFGSFLKKSATAMKGKFWKCFGIGLFFWVISILVSLGAKVLFPVLGGDGASLNDDTIMELFQGRAFLLYISTVLVAPLVEEVLFRGVIFGSIRKRSRFMAHLVSVLLFCFVHSWTYFMEADLVSVLVCTVQYLPLALALSFGYEKTSNLWTAILMHMCNNLLAITLQLL